MFLLYLLDDIIIFILLLLLNDLLESRLTNSETWLPYDQIWVLLLLFNYPCCDVTCDDVVATDRGSILFIFYKLSLEF